MKFICVTFLWLISLEHIWNIPFPTKICFNVPIEIYWNYKQHNTVDKILKEANEIISQIEESEIYLHKVSKHGAPKCFMISIYDSD